jgi:hypothetical protein
MMSDVFSEMCILMPRPGPDPIVMLVLGIGIGIWIISIIWVFVWVKENGRIDNEEDEVDADTPE